MSIKDELVDRTKLCAEFGISECSVYNWIKRGEMPEPYTTIGRRKYWTAEQVDNVKKRIMRRD